MDPTMLNIAQSTAKVVIARFLRRHPNLDREELLGEVQPIVLKALRSYSPKKASVRTWVYIKVSSFLNNYAKLASWRRRMAKQSHLPLEHDPHERRDFSLARLLLEVSRDAQTAIDLALSEDLKKTSLIRSLRREFGWETELIVKVWDEIREAL